MAIPSPASPDRCYRYAVMLGVSVQSKTVGKVKVIIVLLLLSKLTLLLAGAVSSRARDCVRSESRESAR